MTLLLLLHGWVKRLEIIFESVIGDPMPNGYTSTFYQVEHHFLDYLQYTSLHRNDKHDDWPLLPEFRKVNATADFMLMFDHCITVSNKMIRELEEQDKTIGPLEHKIDLLVTFIEKHIL